MNAIPLALYVTASGAYAVHFARPDGTWGPTATLTLVAGALAHTFVIGMQTMQVGHIPFVGTTGAISAFVWLLALAYLYTEMTADERSMGIFLVPLMVVLQTIPALGNSVAARPPVLESRWFEIHVFSLLVAYASLALACVVSVTYVLLFKELKAKHPGVFYARLPSLQVLDAMNRRTVGIGWLFLTIGIGVGVIWTAQLQPGAVDPRVQAMSPLDPKIFIVVLCWLVYGFGIVARSRLGWGGRRAAWLSTAGFAILLLNFVPIGYFGTETHNFY
ncbi:MAG: cytochrome c biogenesis protein CcsA [Acidobacteria bacterium]|nr:cytochrome c biogenesis protein CcsA [Acidobacteriota bacterium]